MCFSMYGNTYIYVYLFKAWQKIIKTIILSVLYVHFIKKLL